MPIDPEELLPRKKAPEIVLGEDLSTMSAHELEARITALETEIARARGDRIAPRDQGRSGHVFQALSIVKFFGPGRVNINDNTRSVAREQPYFLFLHAAGAIRTYMPGTAC